MNKHFVPTTQATMKSPNNYSISTLHYMERYQLIAPEKSYTSGILYSINIIHLFYLIFYLIKTNVYKLIRPRIIFLSLNLINK